MRLLGHRTSFVVAGLMLLVAWPVRADVELPVLAAPAPRVRVDGWLVEWPANQFATVGVDARGRLRFAMAPGERGLYLVASVDDDRLVRTARPAAGEDAVVVTIALPGEGGAIAASEITLYAGVADSTAASLTVGPLGGRASSPREARIVEMATASGYDIEAFVPWSALGGAREVAQYRAMVRLEDVDQTGAAVRKVASVAAAQPAPEALPRVVGTAGELYGLTMFLRDRSARMVDVEAEVRANLSGDATLERVFVLNGELVVVGASYAGGRDYHFARVGAGRGAFADLRALDVDGDGRSEVFAIVRRNDGEVTVAEARIFRFPGDRIQPMFRAEIGLSAGANSFVSEYLLETPRGQLPALRIRAAQPTGAATRPPAHVPQPDAVALLTASTGLASRLYRFAGGSFGVVEEEAAALVSAAGPAPTPPSSAVAPTPAAGTSTRTVAPSRGRSRGRSATPATTATPPPAASASATPPAVPVQPAAATPRTGQSFDPAPLYEVVRRERGIPAATRPRYVTQADLVEDARPETLCVLGRSLVIVGPGYRGGMGYFALDLDVPTEADVRGLEARDITGDGKAEVWLTVRQTVGTGPFWLDLLVVHRVEGQGMQPVFAAQIGFGDSTREVRNEARVVGSGRSLQIALTPGQARGFDARSFPFTSTATPGMATLLLPWRDRETRYRWNGNAVVGP